MKRLLDKEVYHSHKREGAGVAQLVEQLIRNQQVSGSSPLAGSSFINSLQTNGHRPRTRWCPYRCLSLGILPLPCIHYLKGYNLTP